MYITWCAQDILWRRHSVDKTWCEEDMLPAVERPGCPRDIVWKQHAVERTCGGEYIMWRGKRVHSST